MSSRIVIETQKIVNTVCILDQEISQLFLGKILQILLPTYSISKPQASSVLFYSLTYNFLIYSKVIYMYIYVFTHYMYSLSSFEYYCHILHYARVNTVYECFLFLNILNLVISIFSGEKIYNCLLPLWRAARGSKLMCLELIHGLFIT